MSSAVPALRVRSAPAATAATCSLVIPSSISTAWNPSHHASRVGNYCCTTKRAHTHKHAARSQGAAKNSKFKTTAGTQADQPRERNSFCPLHENEQTYCCVHLFLGIYFSRQSYRIFVLGIVKHGARCVRYCNLGIWYSSSSTTFVATTL